MTRIRDIECQFWYLIPLEFNSAGSVPSSELYNHTAKVFSAICCEPVDEKVPVAFAVIVIIRASVGVVGVFTTVPVWMVSVLVDATAKAIVTTYQESLIITGSVNNISLLSDEVTGILLPPRVKNSPSSADPKLPSAVALCL